MKKLFSVVCTVLVIMLVSCGNHSDTKGPVVDTLSSGASQAIDSGANNNVLPPSAAPGNANNSSLADTTYKAKDSLKKKK